MNTNTLTITRFFKIFSDVESRAIELLDHKALQFIMGNNLLLASEYYSKEYSQFIKDIDTLVSTGKVLSVIDCKGKVEYYMPPKLDKNILFGIQRGENNTAKKTYNKEELESILESDGLSKVPDYILLGCMNKRKYGYRIVSIVKNELTNRGIKLNKANKYTRAQKLPIEEMINKIKKEDVNYVKYKRK